MKIKNYIPNFTILFLVFDVFTALPLMGTVAVFLERTKEWKHLELVLGFLFLKTEKQEQFLRTNCKK